MMKICILFYFIFTFGLTQDNIGGKPFSLENNLELNIKQITLPQVNVEKLLNEDLNHIPGTPMRYGYKFDVNYSLNNSGSWIELENGDRIWQLAIFSKNAYALSLEYDDFYLPKNSSLYIYNQNKTMIAGGYTSANNQDDKLFSTPLIEGELIIIEYYESQESYGEGIININYVIHDYKDILNFSSSRESRSCGDNVVCNSANSYEDQINATSWLDMGGYMCSGAMINNTSFDLTPYYWTAWHCIIDENPSTFRFYFNYETSSCNGSWANTGSYEYGSIVLEDSNGMDSDYALLLITDNTISNNIFYSGWDKSSSNPIISCGVHHPNGDPKKINFDDDTAYSSGAINWQGQGSSPAGSHWRVLWDEGGTYGGSSGSPVFNNEGLLVGQLSGGSGNCYSGDTEDFYGKFSRAFSDVSSYLDPINSGQTQIQGTYDGVNNSDADGDGVLSDEDSNDNNPYVCSDNDNDSCDDCSNGNYDLSNDGWDYDQDGICDNGDSDDDNDGIPDNQDSDDNNEFECLNQDGDSCDDCALGFYNPENDGCTFSLGDVNLDESINIVDVVILVGIVLGQFEPSDTQLDVSDMNNDDSLNVADIVILVSIILG